MWRREEIINSNIYLAEMAFVLPHPRVPDGLEANQTKYPIQRILPIYSAAFSLTAIKQNGRSYE